MEQRVSNIALINIEREYATLVVNNDMDRTIGIFGHGTGRHLFLLTYFMSSYDRFICKNIFTLTAS